MNVELEYHLVSKKYNILWIERNSFILTHLTQWYMYIYFFTLIFWIIKFIECNGCKKTQIVIVFDTWKKNVACFLKIAFYFCLLLTRECRREAKTLNKHSTHISGVDNFFFCNFIFKMLRVCLFVYFWSESYKRRIPFSIDDQSPQHDFDVNFQSKTTKNNYLECYKHGED